MNYQDIPNNPERIVNLIPFIVTFNWDNIDFLAGHKDYSAFERDNGDIALNILFVPHNTQEIRQSYISKHNKMRNTQASLLMITNGTGNWHYLTIKSMSALL